MAIKTIYSHSFQTTYRASYLFFPMSLTKFVFTPTNSHGLGVLTRSVFKRSSWGFISEFSFSTGYLPKAKKQFALLFTHSSENRWVHAFLLGISEMKMSPLWFELWLTIRFLTTINFTQSSHLSWFNGEQNCLSDPCLLNSDFDHQWMPKSRFRKKGFITNWYITR